MCECGKCDKCKLLQHKKEAAIEFENILAHYETFKLINKDPITTFGDYIREHSKKETK